MTDHDDRILEACLEEVLGEQTPPDLSDRILNALAARADRMAVPLPGEAPPPVPIPLRERVSPAPAPSAGRSSWQKPAWFAAAVAAGLLIAAAGYGLLHETADRPAEHDLVQQPHKLPAESITRSEGGQAEHAPQNPQQPAPRPDESMIAAPSSAANSPTTTAPLPKNPPAPKPGAVVTSPPPVIEPPIEKPKAPGRMSVPQIASGSRTDEEIVAEINGLVRARWTVEGIKPAVAASEAEWCRRVYLDVVGRVPTLEETSRYLAQRGPQKRARLIDRLLNSDTGVEEYARNWTNIWSSLLIGRTSQAESVINREGMQQYLRRALLRNKPYDELVGELVSAEGVNTPGAEGFNGAVNFVLGNLDVNGVPVTAKTARLFLGVQVQCTQCHNHPFNDWKQGRFWELNAFFRQTKAIGDVAVVDGSAASSDPSSEATVSPDAAPRRANAIAARVADVDFYGEGDARDDDAEIYYEERSGRLKAAYPVFFDGTEIARSGELSQVNRRKELARLVTGSPRFAEAAVNRVWSHFFGHGFTRPIDDMGPHNPPTHPELLERLAREFAAGGYDLKSLVRWIALSEAYALSSKPSRDNQHDDPTAGNPPLFSRYYLRQMRAEQLYESLAAASGEMRPRGDGRNASDDARAASGGDLSDEAYAEREQDKAAWMRQFVIAYRTDECDECSLFVGSIPQTLAMMNGDMTAEATDTDTSGLLAKIARSPVSDAKKVQQLFLAALARNPTPGEQTAARRLIAAHGNDTAAGLEDLWWALLNSNEFIMDR